MKFLKKYYPICIFTIIFTFGFLRAYQISFYERSVGKSTMSSSFIFIAYSIVAMLLFISSLLIKILSSITSEKFNINVKILLITIICSLSFAISAFILLIFH